MGMAGRKEIYIFNQKIDFVFFSTPPTFIAERGQLHRLTLILLLVVFFVWERLLVIFRGAKVNGRRSAAGERWRR